jgi:hypothetical protein
MAGVPAAEHGFNNPGAPMNYSHAGIKSKRRRLAMPACHVVKASDGTFLPVADHGRGATTSGTFISAALRPPCTPTWV